MKNKNGREMPHASFNKATAHIIINDHKELHLPSLSKYKVKESDRNFRVWQRDPLAILLYSREIAEQKLDYIHRNPLQEKWNLADEPENYKWSSARFYERGIDDFGFMSHYMERL